MLCFDRVIYTTLRSEILNKAREMMSLAGYEKNVFWRDLERRTMGEPCIFLEILD